MIVNVEKGEGLIYEGTWVVPLTPCAKRIREFYPDFYGG
jgi:hypothetical protein